MKKQNMQTYLKQGTVALALMASANLASADVIDFFFTGQLTVADEFGNIISNNGLTATPISANLSYDTVSGIGGSDLNISVNGSGFLGVPVTFHDITMARVGTTSAIQGNVLVDWNGTNNMNLDIVWDASGLFNAIDIGLQVGDTISGTTLIRAGSPDVNVGSATPYADSLSGQTVIQNFAPLAATSDSLGLLDGPFVGVRGYFDIGSGNSLHVTGLSAVPVPAAVWLFGSGLLALVGLGRKTKP